MKFEKVSLINFPAEECLNPLNLNSNFYKGTNEKLIVIKDKKTSGLIIKKALPCLGEKSGEDIFGFIGDSELEFYNIEKDDYEILFCNDSTASIDDLLDIFTKGI